MNRVCQLFVYFVIVYVRFIGGQSYVGDYCSVSSTGESGVCQLLQNCMSAIQALQSSGVYPQTCGFQFNQPIVCCAGGGGAPVTPVPVTPTKPPTPITPKTPVSVVTPKLPTTKTTLRPKNPVFQKVGDKAVQKCKEYGEYVNVVERPPVNLPGAKPYVRADCAIVEVPLIVGGEIAKPKEFPHMALIGFEDENGDKKWQCGGSLISEEYILTAAHCLYDKQYGEPKYIKLGDLDTSKTTDDAKPQELKVLRTIKHPLYKAPSQYNDIALIQMEKKATLNPYVRPICLNTETSLTTKHAIASGWGKTGYTADTSNELQKVTLEYFSHSECNTTYKSNIGLKLRYGILPDTQVCAGSHDESKDTCQGDSGGPLQVYNGKQVYCTYRIVGVTSFGRGCGIVPGVYTLVSAYIEWIENTVWP